MLEGALEMDFRPIGTPTRHAANKTFDNASKKVDDIRFATAAGLTQSARKDFHPENVRPPPPLGPQWLSLDTNPASKAAS
jgi:hypothetical protein